MNQINLDKRKTDQAWNQLYTRLESDGLLQQDISCKPSVSTRIRAVKWAAAIAVICISAVTVIMMTRQNTPSIALLTVENDEAATRITTLEDGSIVYLADKARIQFPEHFETDKRELKLEGDALFDVSGNKERPFYIETEEVRIEVLGTSFDVRSTKDTPFELSVRRGEVKVTSKHNGQNCIVKAGETAKLLSKALQVLPTSKDDLSNYSRRISFKDEKLGDILRVLNREFSDKIFNTTSSLEDKRINIAFENNSPNEMAELICIGFDLKYTEKDKVLFISEP